MKWQSIDFYVTVDSIEEIVAADKMAREAAESVANELVYSNRRVAKGLAQ